MKGRRELDFLLPRPFAPGSESSRCRTFASWYFPSEWRIEWKYATGSESYTSDIFWSNCMWNVMSRRISSLLYSLVGAKVPGCESSTPGTFAPRSERSWERKVHNSGRRGDVSATTTFAAQRDAAQETWAAPQHFRTSQKHPVSSTHNAMPLYSYFLLRILRSTHMSSSQHSRQTSSERYIDLRHRRSPHLSRESWVGLKDSDAIMQLNSSQLDVDLTWGEFSCVAINKPLLQRLAKSKSTKAWPINHRHWDRQ